MPRLTTTTEHLTAQLQETKAELKTARTETRPLQAELLTLARGGPTGGKGTKCPPKSDAVSGLSAAPGRTNVLGRAADRS